MCKRLHHPICMSVFDGFPQLACALIFAEIGWVGGFGFQDRARDLAYCTVAPADPGMLPPPIATDEDTTWVPPWAPEKAPMPEADEAASSEAPAKKPRARDPLQTPDTQVPSEFDPSPCRPETSPDPSSSSPESVVSRLAAGVKHALSNLFSRWH